MHGLLAATVIHDLKNELAILTGSLSALRENAAGTVMEADARRSCAIAAKLSQNLVSFLTVYRAEEQGLPVRLMDHNPEDFLRDLQNGLILPATAPGVSVDMTEPVAPFWFYDAYLAQLAIESAIQNAVRFARSAVILSACMRDGYLVFRVEDDGAGLDAPGAPSTGLGATLCAAIAKAHRRGGLSGKVELKNRPHGGAVFELWLP